MTTKTMSPPDLTHESALLLTLEEISQLVAHSHDLRETLANIVRLIQGRFHADVCSVYLLEPERQEVVLGATVGLRPESVGQVRMRLDQGLTGLVAEQMAPVAVGEAFEHPRFRYFPEAGEDPYHSFLGVPLVEGGALQGVLVVQTVAPRTFSTNETRLLVAVAAQLAPLVSGARLMERVATLAHDDHDRGAAATEADGPLRGMPLSPGTGLGEAYVINGFNEWRHYVAQQSTDPCGEARRLTTAMEAARAEISQLSQRISALVGQDHGAILQAQLMLMQDRAIDRDLADCLSAGRTAEGALVQVLDRYVSAFQQISSPLLQERIYDLKDVFRRILWHLQPHAAPVGNTGAPLVLVAHEASVMDLFAVDLERLAGIVVERGGAQSHAAILGRSLGIPMVSQVPEAVRRMGPGRQMLVDGTVGTVTLDPSPELTAAFRRPHGKWASAIVAEPTSEVPAGDGPRVEVNINLLCEVPQALQQHAAGVGLYRTEFLFLARRTLPTEEEQLAVYQKLLEMLQGRPASIRTFDLRPDKLAHAGWNPTTAETLDWRLVLGTPLLQKLFKDQVRAILRAAVAGPARILVPLVTRTELLDFVFRALDEARTELEREGLEFDSRVPVGIMIETAGAAAMMEAWARHVDYFSLGTNDLIASALGFDRQDAVGADRDDALHPGVLRLIGDAVTAAHRAGRLVTVCGEMAADPEAALALAALQVDALSVPVAQLGPVRQILSARKLDVPAGLNQRLMNLRRAEEARTILSQWANAARGTMERQVPHQSTCAPRAPR
jgi:phosphotransferase system, enzyme I, PtsP